MSSTFAVAFVTLLLAYDERECARISFQSLLVNQYNVVSVQGPGTKCEGSCNAGVSCNLCSRCLCRLQDLNNRVLSKLPSQRWRCQRHQQPLMPLCWSPAPSFWQSLHCLLLSRSVVASPIRASSVAPLMSEDSFGCAFQRRSFCWLGGGWHSFQRCTFGFEFGFRCVRCTGDPR